MTETENSRLEIIDKSKREWLIEEINLKLETNYVLEDKIPLFKEALSDASKSGKLETTDPVEFGTIVNNILHDVYPDKHLNFMYFNEETGKFSSGGNIRIKKRPPHASSNSNENGSKSRPKMMKMNDLPGLIDYKIIDKNTGYMKINLFKPLEESELQKYTEATTLIQPSDHLIIDLRDCRGGVPESIAHLSSFLFGSEKVLLAKTYFRRDDTTLERWTSGWNEPNYSGKPVYVLVSPRTGSGGESFAYSLQHLNRGTIVGQKTAGAGLMVDSFDLGDHFKLNVSIGRSYDPKTGKGFELVGVQPDIIVEETEALDHVLKIINN